MEKLKRAVIKEELVAITGDYIEAIILGQMMYWAERVNDFDLFIKEENERVIKYSVGEEQPQLKELLHGWIYKKASELKDEIMLPDSEKTVNRKLCSLVEKGYLERRNNPVIKYDRTYQYRVNYENIFTEMIKKGYMPQDYTVSLQFIYNVLKSVIEKSQRQIDDCKGQTDFSNENEKIKDEIYPGEHIMNAGQKTFQGQIDVCNGQIDDCKGQIVGAIPEITTENTITENTYVYPIVQSINLSIYQPEEETFYDGLIDNKSTNDINKLVNKEKSAYQQPVNNNNTNECIKVSFVKYLKDKYKLSDMDIEICLSRIKDRTDIKNINQFLEVVVKNYIKNERDTYIAARDNCSNLNSKDDVVKIGDRKYDIDKLEKQLLGRNV